MNRLIALILIIVTTLSLSACTPEQKQLSLEPDVAQMRAICELATMECYYHNVAKFKEENVPKALWGLIKGNKHFWIEYSGQVTVGIDASLVNIEVNGDKVKITIPPATVQNSKVHQESLTEESFILASGSIAITAEDQLAAFGEAQENMLKTASNDTAMLANAQQRAQDLLEDYINNIGDAIGVEYQIEWVYVNANTTSEASDAA